MATLIWLLLVGFSGLRFVWLASVGIGWFVGEMVGAGWSAQPGLRRPGPVPAPGAGLGFLGLGLSLLTCLLVLTLSAEEIAWSQFRTGAYRYAASVDWTWPALVRIFFCQWSDTDSLALAFAGWEGWHFACRRARRPDLPTWNLLLLNDPLQYRGRLCLVVLFLALMLFLTFLGFERSFIAEAVVRPDGQVLAVRVTQGERPEHELILWDWPAERRLATVPFSQLEIKEIAWSQDGGLLAIVANPPHEKNPQPGQLILWDPVRRQERARWRGHANLIHCLAFAPDGQTLATAGRDGAVRLWDLRNFQELAALPQPGNINRLAFSPDGQLLAAATLVGEITVWDVLQRQPRHSWQAHDTGITVLSFAPDGRAIFSSGGMDGLIKSWNAGQFGQQAEWALSDLDWITHLAWSPDGRTAAVAGGGFDERGAVLLLDAANGRELGSFTVPTNTVTTVVFSRDGKTLLAGTAPSISPFTAHRQGSLWRWNIATRRELPPLP